jgi:hypothetical protein
MAEDKFRNSFVKTPAGTVVNVDWHAVAPETAEASEALIYQKSGRIHTFHDRYEKTACYDSWETRKMRTLRSIQHA